jgi:secernin
MCDTFVVMPSATADGSMIFGKNSDREPNEAQALAFFPPRKPSPGDVVRCTYHEIPEAGETLPVLISRPFWMWGAEMGCNDRGVVIGNEAVFTKMPISRDAGLTGMDLLRLALERGTTAQAALDVIVGLLADFGQGGICGYEDRRMTYHNSYIIADTDEAWVLETAGPLWAAKRVETQYSISNRLTIGEQFDAAHPDLIDTAKQKGWLKKGRQFHFADCYSDWFYTTFSASGTRCRKSGEIIEACRGRFSLRDGFRLLRDHGASVYQAGSHFLGDRVCMHAANPLARNAQTTGSLIAHHHGNTRTYWATGTAAPCTAVFKPIWFAGEVLPDVGPAPGATFHPDSLWWNHERLHRMILLDYEKRMGTFREDRNHLENSWVDAAGKIAAEERYRFSEEVFLAARKKEREWVERVAAMPAHKTENFIYRRYWSKQNQRADMASAV